MIRAEGIYKTYGQTEVLRGIDLQIEDGAFVVVLGASGSGKTTLLRILSGLETPDEGRVCYGDTAVSSMSEKERTAFRRENVGFVFQQYCLLPELTAGKNVRLGADLAEHADWRAALEAVGLKGKENRYPSALSGGEKQRVSIARAIAKRPRVLFLDEPTGALDEQTGRQVLDLLLTLHREQKNTVVFVTHNQNIAEVADSVVTVGSGKIVRVSENQNRKSAFEIGW